MRTQEQLVQKCTEQLQDVFSFQLEVLLSYLTLENALPFISDEYNNEEKWNEIFKEMTRETIIEEMKDYMAFAWGKAIDHRGLSAGRSIEKMQAWLWLLEDEESIEFAKNDLHYTNYGAPILMYISTKYNFPVPDNEDARMMARGEKCKSCCEFDNGCC